MVRAELEKKNLGHCLWGFLDGSSAQFPVVKELTQENTTEFIRSCWTDSTEDIVLAVHLQEVFVWFDDVVYPLELRSLRESEVFEAIDSLMKRMSLLQKATFHVGTEPVEFKRENVGLFLEAWAFNVGLDAGLGPVNLQLNLAKS